MIREAMCDAEASFYVPGHGLRREALETKNYSITPSQFWDEIDTFRRVDASSPGTFQWFTLVSTGLSAPLEPLVNGLRRVRDPYAFYDEGSGVREQSYADYQERVRKLEKEDDLARFLFARVLIEPDWATAQADAEALFRQRLITHHPEFAEFPNSALTRAYQNLLALVKSRKNRPVARGEIEAALAAALPPGASLGQPALRVHTATSADVGPAGALRLEWNRFFGGEGRDYPPPTDWNAELVGGLTRLKEWILSNERPRKIRLSGSRRLSTSLAIGTVFSAVSGFNIEVENRDEVWRTDEHANPQTPAYSLSAELIEGKGPRLAVAIGIGREVLGSVRAHLNTAGYPETPILSLHGTEPVLGAAHANAIVRLIKDQLAASLAKSKTQAADLFFAGPGPLALFLGHRLNATSPVRCHEWLPDGRYTPTCELYERVS